MKKDSKLSVSKIIAIDPGKSGGIAVLNKLDRSVIEVTKMPDTPKDIFDFLSTHAENSIVYLEKVWGIPGQSSSASFTFGQGYGWLEMATISLNIPLVLVPAVRWQKWLQLGNAVNLSKTDWKNKLKRRAQDLFPKIKVTLSNADALLIGVYGCGQ